MKSNITVLVNSCDSYSDAWYPFFTLWKKYWPDSKFPVIFGNGENFLWEKIIRTSQANRVKICFNDDG